MIDKFTCSVLQSFSGSTTRFLHIHFIYWILVCQYIKHNYFFGVRSMNLKRAGVVGYPIGHTMSPFIHKRLFRLSGLPWAYQVCEIENLQAGWETLTALDAFNVTIPHKTHILPLLDELDEKASLFGSVNTVCVKNRRTKGYTTDGYGCLRALQSENLEPRGTVLLLGNGGAARAIAFEIALAGRVEAITIVCREGSAAKAEKLKNTLGEMAAGKNIAIQAEVISYAQAEAQNMRYNLLINTTSVGMYPHVGHSPVSEALVQRCGGVFDAVYNPNKTLCIQYAEKNGIHAVTGMKMLVYQAVAAHEIWYGAKFLEQDIEILCADAVTEMKKLFQK